MKKLRPRTVRILFWVALAIGAITGFAGVFFNNDPLLFIGLGIMFGSVVFYAIFYRCPHCGRYLDRSTGPYCPYCRKEVNKF